MTNESGLRPSEFNVVVAMDPTETVSKGGILLPTQVTDREKLAAEEGTLVAVSPHAFTYADWPAGETPPRVGDRVLIARYGGVMHERAGKTFRILKDKDIVAVIEPAATLAVAA